MLYEIFSFCDVTEERVEQGVVGMYSSAIVLFFTRVYLCDSVIAFPIAKLSFLRTEVLERGVEEAETVKK